MSYQTAGMGGGPQVTYIDDLPDLDFHESAGPQPFQQATRDHVRSSRYPGNENLPPDQESKFQKYIRNGTRQLPSESGMNEFHPEPGPSVPDYSEPIQAPPYPVRTGPSCLDVADHISTCPICSKLYKDDKVVYLIAIVVLAIIVIILLKKILDL